MKKPLADLQQRNLRRPQHSAPTVTDAIGRKRLKHEIPEGAAISTEAEVFFITVCCVPRGKNQLAKADVWQVIEETLLFREESGLIQILLALAMPNHL